MPYFSCFWENPRLVNHGSKKREKHKTIKIGDFASLSPPTLDCWNSHKHRFLLQQNFTWTFLKVCFLSKSSLMWASKSRLKPFIHPLCKPKKGWGQILSRWFVLHFEEIAKKSNHWMTVARLRWPEPFICFRRAKMASGLNLTSWSMPHQQRCQANA